MGILDKVQVYSTGQRIPLPVQVELVEEKIGPAPWSDSLWADEFRLELRVVATFVANEAERGRAVWQAKRNLLRALYSDVLDEMAEARQAISYGSREEALRKLDEIYVKLTEVK